MVRRARRAAARPRHAAPAPADPADVAPALPRRPERHAVRRRRRRRRARDVPVASCPCDDRNLHFHVGRDDADAFATLLHAGAIARATR